MKIGNLNESRIVKELKTGGKLILNQGAHTLATVGVVDYTVKNFNVGTAILAPVALVAIGISCYRFGTKIARTARKDQSYFAKFLTAPTLKSAIEKPVDKKVQQLVKVPARQTKKAR